MSALKHIEATDFFEQLESALDHPNFVRPISYHRDNLVALAMLDLARSRKLAKFLRASAEVALDDGRSKHAARALALNNQLAVLFTYQGSMIDSLVGYAIFAIGYDGIQTAIMEHQFTADDLRFLDHAFENLRPIGNATQALDFERATVLDMVQRIYSDDGSDNGRLLVGSASGYLETGVLPSVGSPSRLRNFEGFFYPDRQHYIAKVNDTFDELNRIAGLPPFERFDEAARLDSEADAQKSRYLFLRLVVPTSSKFADAYDEIMASINATQLMIDLERHFFEHDTYPATLEGLTETFPSANGLTDGFGYRLLYDDPHGRAYLLYSFGFDGEDDGGHEDADNPRSAFKPETAEGLDYVYNRPESESGP